MLKVIGIGIGVTGGLAFGAWLGGYVMLYGGILETLNNWGVDNGAVVAGILKAVFFEAGFAAGVIAGMIVAVVALAFDN